MAWPLQFSHSVTVHRAILSILILAAFSMQSGQAFASPEPNHAECIKDLQLELSPREQKKIKRHLELILGEDNPNLNWLQTHVEESRSSEAQLSNEVSPGDAREFFGWAKTKLKMRWSWVRDLIRDSKAPRGSEMEVLLKAKNLFEETLNQIRDLEEDDSLSLHEFNYYNAKVAVVLSLMRDSTHFASKQNGDSEEASDLLDEQKREELIENWRHRVDWTVGRSVFTNRKLEMLDFIALAFENVSMFGTSGDYGYFDQEKTPRSPFSQIVHDGEHKKYRDTFWSEFQNKPGRENFKRYQINLGNSFLDSLLLRARGRKLTRAQWHSFVVLLFWAVHEDPSINLIWGHAGLFAVRAESLRQDFANDWQLILRRANEMSDMGVVGLKIKKEDLEFAYKLISSELKNFSKIYDSEIELRFREIDPSTEMTHR